jgi:hypothetical protein
MSRRHLRTTRSKHSVGKVILILAGVCIAIGVAILVAGRLRTGRLVETEAVVTETRMDRTPFGTGPGRSFCSVTYEFRTKDGKTVRSESEIGTGLFSRLKKGSRLDSVYDPDQPRQSWLKGEMTTGMTSALVMFWIGLVAGGVGLGMGLKGRGRRRR